MLLRRLRSRIEPGSPACVSPGSDRRTSLQEDRFDRSTALLRAAGRIAGATAVLAGLAACGRPATPDPRALEDTLRQRIEQAYDFSRPGIVERMTSLYAAEGTVVSASGGELITTAAELRQGIADFWQNVGQNMENPTWQWGEVHVEPLSRDAAVLTGTWAIPHIAPTGRPHVIHGAWTAVFRRIGGEWLIVHEHLSVPPPPETQLQRDDGDG
jgi:ketosteroid isomerase-like protein